METIILLLLLKWLEGRPVEEGGGGGGGGGKQSNFNSMMNAQ